MATPSALWTTFVSLTLWQGLPARKSETPSPHSSPSAPYSSVVSSEPVRHPSGHILKKPVSLRLKKP